MNETVEFTNLCMVRDGDRVLVIDRKIKRLARHNLSWWSCRSGRIIYGSSNP